MIPESPTTPSAGAADGVDTGGEVPPMVPSTKEDEIIARYREAQASGNPLPIELQKLAGMNFLGRDLSGLDLSGCDFSKAELSRCNFKGTIATHTKFDGATLFQACLDGGEFMASSFRDANLSEASIQNAGLGETRLEGANLVLSNLDGTTLTKSSLKGARLHMASLQEARLLDSDLRGAEFNQANLSGADMRGSDVTGADFGKSDLRGIQLRGLKNYGSANWIGADIRDIDFTGAYLIRRHIVDENYLDEFQNQGKLSRWIYWLWWATSDCGRSLLRWGVLNVGIIICFGLAFKLLPDVHTPVDPEAPLKSAGFGTAVVSGVLLVDDVPVPYDAEQDTLFGMLDRVYSATKGSVQGSYHPESDGIELWSGGTPLKLGDSDGGNLVSAAHLVSKDGHATSGSPIGITTPALFYPSDLQRSSYETIYFSFVVALTLGFGDVLPKTTAAQVMVNLLTLVGYVGLGGLLTIFSNQLGRRGE